MPGPIPPGIVEQMRAGDPDAYTELVTAALPWLTRITYRLTRDHHVAEEVALDALLRLWRHQPRFGTDGQLYVWLRITSHHLALHHVTRAMRRDRIAPVELGVPFHVADRTDHVERVHDRMELQELLSRLTPNEWAVVALRMQGLDLAAIAARLEQPLGTVKSRLHQAQTAQYRTKAPLGRQRRRKAA